MRSCRTASIVAFSALGAMLAIAACRDAERPEVPPLTTAHPDGKPILASSRPSSTASDATEGGAIVSMNAPLEPPVKAKFFDAPAKLEAALCQRVLVAVVKGKVVAMNETLAAGDVLVVAHGESFEATGAGTLVWASIAIPDCAVLSRPPPAKAVVRGAAAAKLEWAHGTMAARLDVAPPNAPDAKGPGKPDAGAKQVAALSPELYLGRLEGTSPVAEHIHSTQWEILAAFEGSGTFVLDGTEGRLGPRQIVMVPPGAKHAWKPEPGSRLVAVQMYTPPGPEQRFAALAAAEKDAGAKDAGIGLTDIGRQ